MMVRIGSWLIAIVVGLTGWASAQVPSGAPRGAPVSKKVPSAAITKASSPKLPETLSGMIGLALRSNPDILLAEARLKEAEAELNQARIKVTQEVVTTHQQYEISGSRLKLTRHLFESNEASQDTMLERKQEQVRLEAKLRYLVGVGSNAPSLPWASGYDTGQPRLAFNEITARTGSDRADTASDPKISDEVRMKLNTKVTCNFVDKPLAEVIQYFGSQADLTFIPSPELKDLEETALGGGGVIARRVPKISLTLGEVPLYTAMIAIADSYEYWFVIRDYGVFVTSMNKAKMIHAPTIPESTAFRR